jgi:tetratricopeptide (TPR) repeat protein
MQDFNNHNNKSTNKNLLLFQRVQKTTLCPPTKVEDNLPGHYLMEELIDEYPSYLISEPPPSSTTLTNTTGGHDPHRDWEGLVKKHKEKGNSLFRISDKYPQAAKEYRRALYCLRRCKRIKEMDELRVQLYVNLSACDIQIGDYSSCRKHCTKALKLDPNNVKALFRRFQSRRYGAFDLTGAEEDLLKAIECNPNDATLKKSLEEFQKSQAKAAQQEAAVAKRMFSS